MLRTALVLLCLVAMSKSQDLCQFHACQCHPNQADPSLLDAHCQCQEKEVLKIGDPSRTSGALSAPDNTGQLTIEGCHHVELFSRTLNQMPKLQNVTLSRMHKLVLHSRLYESRTGTGRTTHLENFSIEQIQHVDVQRHSFEGVSIDGRFSLTDITIQKVPSLAFNFDFVKEFNILGSRFDRVSMWGIKLKQCREFNVLEKSYFYSLASQAFNMKCNKFMLAYNTFGSLQDSSFEVQYGLADIQGNTFETLTGKPFTDLKPIPAESLDGAPSGLVFRENKFRADPNLPFGTLAMPAFDQFHPQLSYVDIDKNHFVCDCDKLAWFIGAVTRDFDKEAIEKLGSGAMPFLKKLFETSGNCLQCDIRSCEAEERTSFVTFSEHALEVNAYGHLQCRGTGLPLRPSSESGNGVNYPIFGTGTTTTSPAVKPSVPQPDESELAELRNENSSSSKTSLSIISLFAVSLVVRVFL